MVNSKHAFWQALIFTIVVFGLGLILGVFLEDSRADRVQLSLVNSEVNVLDDQLRDKIITDFDVSCDVAIASTFDFADKIFEEAIQLEDYNAASQFTEAFDILHRRYDLLRALLWSEGVALKERCGEEFHTVVYLYDSTSEDVDIRSHQNFYSRLLFDLKVLHQDEVLLIPIAADTNLTSVDLIEQTLGVDTLPSIVVDEETVITDIITLEELEEIVFE